MEPIFAALRRNQRGSVQTTIIVFGLGVLVGLSLGLGLRGTEDSIPEKTHSARGQPQAALAKQTTDAGAEQVLLQSQRKGSVASAPASNPLDASVTLQIRYAEGGRTVRWSTAPIGSTRLLILPGNALKGAEEITLTDRRGRKHSPGRIVGVDTSTSLIALDSGMPDGAFLELSDENHPLYLGRDLWLYDDRGQSAAWVDGPAEVRAGSPNWTTPIASDRGRLGAGGVLVDPNSSRVVGIVVGEMPGSAQGAAMDVDDLRLLMRAVPETVPMSLAAFSQSYFEESPGGLWQRVQALARGGRYHDGITLAQSLLERDGRYSEPVFELFERSVLARIERLLAEGSYDQALDLLNPVAAFVGERAGVSVLYALVFSGMNDFDDASAWLQTAAALPAPSKEVTQRLRSLILAQAKKLEQERAWERTIEWLEVGTALEPQYPVFHQWLGRLYLRQDRLKAGIASLTRAMALDSSLVPRLSKRVDEARQLLANPERIRVHFDTNRRAIEVPVTLNGGSAAFRFLLDTGASHTVISRETARTLSIDTNGARQVIVNTANGSMEVPVVTLPSVGLAGAEVPNVTALVVDGLESADGLLGLSYLRYFEVEIHQTEGYLTLRRR